MNKKRIIDEFIRLRAEEVTYDKLVEHLGYSKPTLIAWGKKYANEIKMKKQADLMCQFGNDILMNNETILLTSVQLNRIAKNINPQIKENLFKQKMINKLEKIFGKNINSVILKLDKSELIHEIKIEFDNNKKRRLKEK